MFPFDDVIMRVPCSFRYQGISMLNDHKMQQYQNNNFKHNKITYRKTSSISRTKSQNLNVSRLVLWLSSPDPLKSGAKSIMKM